ncbi:MAG: thiamine-phosphate pyrophosphorylase [Candidatus Omnitrophica bacterium]|nr:thiamine-phosphate pyrophosphorylase [Candidatus Omnitrophota bacterium]
MSSVTTKKVLRVIDANFNRAKEGLRVCEDVCRFLYDDRAKTRKYKEIRHKLTAVVGKLGIAEIVKAREIEADVGRKTSSPESKRKDVADIFYANSQRVKESVRVLEEFAKLIDGKVAERLKRLRYLIYSCEKEIVRGLKKEV